MSSLQKVTAAPKRLLVVGAVFSVALLAAFTGATRAVSAPLAAGIHNDTAFTYGGTWNVATGAAYYQGDEHRTARVGRTYQFDFTGTQAQLFGTKARGMGIMSVSVDGGPPVNVDLYAAARRSQVLLYATPELMDGTHHVDVTVTGTKNAAASGKTVNIDRADVVAPTVEPPPPTDPPPTTGSFHAFNQVTLTGEFNIAGEGSNVDSIAFWEGASAEESLMFVTSKSLSLVEVWRHPFNSQAAENPSLRHPCLQATADSATNGVVVDQEAELLYVASNRSPNVCVFSLPDLTYRMTISSGVSYGLEPNLAFLKLPDGTKRLYVSNDRVVYVHDATSGELLSQFNPVKGLETMWGDDVDQVLYVPDEDGRTGVYAYTPDGTDYLRNGASVLGNSTIFSSDAEGIIEYTCPASGTTDNGAGLIIVSDQIDSAASGNDYEVFDRQSWAHLGKIKLKLPGGTGYVYNTDGIGTSQQASTLYPGGIFTVIQDDKSVVGIGWNKVFAAIASQTGQPFGCGS